MKGKSVVWIFLDVGMFCFWFVRVSGRFSSIERGGWDGRVYGGDRNGFSFGFCIGGCDGIVENSIGFEYEREKFMFDFECVGEWFLGEKWGVVGRR